MKATLIQDNGLNRIYQISTGERINSNLDEDELIITVINSTNQEIGSLEFKEIEEEHGFKYKLKWMYLDKLNNVYKQKGLGKACVELFIDYFSVIIHAAENNGQTQDNGSHLTQDAPRFVAQLRNEGLII